ncbi:hypothetical protein ACN6LA_001387 [Streptomyces sp. SAS_269]|uniref:hypothetical protein n=1 Tax=Streptomyces sp. SAS_269 TaxID=3412749 RepID=UPI00403CD793
MTLTAAPFGTAVRALRTAAGRRALQLVLLLGGLLALGFLCGEQAHAAEGTPTTPVSSVLPRTGHEDAPTAEAETVTAPSPTAPTATARSVTAPTATAPTATAPTATAATVTERAVTSVHGITDGTVVEQAVTSVEAVTERVVTPVRTVVRETADTLDEARATALPGTSSLPVPELPGVSERLPVHHSPTPVTPEPRPDRHGDAAPAAGQADRPGAESAEGTGHRTTAPARPSDVTYGPDAVPVTAQAPAHTPAGHGTASAGAPAQRPAPSGDPDGALGKQAADGTASRHGDAHAIALDGRAPLRLLPGSTARVDAQGTRERHRDIPLFPG